MTDRSKLIDTRPNPRGWSVYRTLAQRYGSSSSGAKCSYGRLTQGRHFVSLRGSSQKSLCTAVYKHWGLRDLIATSNMLFVNSTLETGHYLVIMNSKPETRNLIY